MITILLPAFSEGFFCLPFSQRLASCRDRTGAMPVEYTKTLPLEVIMYYWPRGG